MILHRVVVGLIFMQTVRAEPARAQAQGCDGCARVVWNRRRLVSEDMPLMGVCSREKGKAVSSYFTGRKVRNGAITNPCI
jgi:hypothetical protein